MRDENVVLVARALAFYLLCWMVSDLISMPERIIEVYHHLRYTHEHTFTIQEHLQNTSVLNFGFEVIRIILLFIAAGWLYRCGPKVRAFFLEPTPGGESKELSV